MIQAGRGGFVKTNFQDSASPDNRSFFSVTRRLSDILHSSLNSGAKKLSVLRHRSQDRMLLQELHGLLRLPSVLQQLLDDLVAKGWLRQAVSQAASIASDSYLRVRLSRP